MSSLSPSSSSSSSAAATSGFTICQQLPEFPSVKELEGAAQAEQEGGGGGGGESGGEAAAAAAAETCQQQQHQLPQLPNPPSAVASDKIQTLVRRSQHCRGLITIKISAYPPFCLCLRSLCTVPTASE